MGLMTYVLFWFLTKLNIFLFVICFLLLGWGLYFLIWGLFKIACVFIVLAVRKISPSLRYGAYTFFTLFTIGAIFNIYNLWGANKIDGFVIFMNIVFTFTTLGFTGTMMKVAGVIPESEWHKYAK